MMQGRPGRAQAVSSRAGEMMRAMLDVDSTFTDEEHAALAALPRDDASFNARQTIVHAGDVPTRCCLLVDGYAASFKLLPDGARQIVALHVAGDIMDVHSLTLGAADHGITVLGQARVAYLPHAGLRELFARSGAIMNAFWHRSHVDGAIAREWLLNIGQREAYARMAHLFCELRVRLQAAGLYRNDGFQLPLTQAELGDVLALTPVHINRTLQRLRADGLIRTSGSELCIEDWDGLVEAGSFDADYLRLSH